MLTGTVRDILIPLNEYPTVYEDATLHDVFATLKEKHDSSEQFRSALVLDAKDHLVGMLGLRDLLHALLPDYLHHGAAHFEGKSDDVAALALLWQDDCAEQVRKASMLRVRGSVTPIKITVAASDPLSKAVFLFATHNTNILPVVEAGRIIGVLRIVDAAHEVANAVFSSGESA
ncbi:MAG: CBS domain-containing protein [Betaproteobacteria bacterium]|nr:CBS domain-containing protein [Betaproteobacteria bacterium]